MGKRGAILDAAKRLFSTRGFAGTNMDAVAKAAEVSKHTVYRHFGDKEGLCKEGLCKAAIESKCERQIPAGLFSVPPETPIREALLAIARGFQEPIHRPESLC